MHIRGFYQAALEQLQVDSGPEALEPVISDTSQLALEMDQTSQEMQRLSDITDALQDVVCSVEGLNRADAHHLRLLEACLNMSQAGSYQTAEQIQPSLESYLGTQISTEGVVSAIQRFLQHLLRLMRELWHRIAEFFARIFGEVGRLRIRLQYVSALVAEVDGKEPVRDVVQLGSYAYLVATEQGFPQDARGVLTPLQHLLDQLRAMRAHVVPTLVAVGEQFNRQLPSLPSTVEETQGWLQRMNAIASGFHPHTLASTVGRPYPSHNPQYPRGSALVLAPLPGSRSLAFIDGTKVYPEKAEGAPEERAMAYQAHAIVLERQRQAANLDMAAATMPTLSNDQLQEIYRLVEEIVDEVDGALKSGLKTKLLNLTNPATRIERYLKTLESAETHHALLQRGLRYWPTYARWVQSSYIQMLSHSLMVARATLSLVAEHCRAFHRSTS